MPSRRQFILGTSGALAGAVVLGGTAFAQEPIPPAADSASADRAASRDAYSVERTERQSPINIVTSSVVAAPDAPPLIINYPTNIALDVEYISKDAAPAGCSVRREDETIEGLAFSQRAIVTINGERYRLLQFHFHTRSEHTVNGAAFPIEQHFVHERVSDGKLMVIGVFLNGGGAAPQDQVLAAPLPAECAAPKRINNINLRGMLPADLTSYRYPGSLTTPEFDQGVRWHVMRTPVRISDATISRFQQVFPAGNSRPVQPLNGRTVRLVPGRLA